MYVRKIKLGDDVLLIRDSEYEEGTFTGKLYNDSVPSIATGKGEYRRVGNMVYVYVQVFSTSGIVPKGMSGLPFPHLGNISANNKSELFFYGPSSDVINRPDQIDVGDSILFPSGTASGSGSIEVFGWYRINTAAL